MIKNHLYDYINQRAFCCFAATILLAANYSALIAQSAANEEETTVSSLDSTRLQSDQEMGLHPWQRYIRGFRDSHHFSLVLGYASERWNFSKVTDIAQPRFENSDLSLKLKYHYHIKITYDYGFFLGTTMGISHMFSSSKSSIDANTILNYPGLFAGVVYNLSPNTVMWLGLERYLERIDPITIDFTNTSSKNGLTMTTYDFSLGMDYFIVLNWALTFEAHARFSEHNRLQSKENSINSLDIAISRQDFGLGFGLTFHIL